MSLSQIEKTITAYWYNQHAASWLLPFAWIFQAVVILRRFLYKKSLLTIKKSPIPIIVVGNITVGGTGKTPCVIALIDLLKKVGLKPGIVSRGYGAKLNKTATPVKHDSLVVDVGDESLLLKRRCNCPVVIAKKRVSAVDWIINYTDCNVIVSDDGLQHYAMDRAFEIVMIDGARGVGNRQCLPVGPLREPISRISTCDLVIINGDDQRQICNEIAESVPVANMKLTIQALQSVNQSTQATSIEVFKGQAIHAVTGIGNPTRFFDVLIQQGFEVIEHAFADHHRFSQADFDGFSDQLIFLTEKDAVKCEQLDLPQAFMVRTDAHFGETVAQVLHTAIKRWALR